MTDLDTSPDDCTFKPAHGFARDHLGGSITLTLALTPGSQCTLELVSTLLNQDLVIWALRQAASSLEKDLIP